MGLDMYAYAIKANVVGPEPTDVDAYTAARVAVGFTPLASGELNKLSIDEQNQYWDKEQAAKDEAVECGVFVPKLAYWRKFNALHAWMEALYYAKGGKSNSFNCVTVRIDVADLDKLEADAKTGNLKPAAGFFWGEQEIYPEDLEDLAKFIADARKAIVDGYAVYYDSWW